MNEQDFLDAIRLDRTNDQLRLVFADWLDDHGDRRADFLRAQLAIAYLSIDHPVRRLVDPIYSTMIGSLDEKWRSETRHPRVQLDRGRCHCYGKSAMLQNQRITLHNGVQDFTVSAWEKLQLLIDQAAEIGAERFSPLNDLDQDEREQITSLPPSIGELTNLKELYLYGSHLRSLPPEIGKLTKLEKFAPYTSYSLHWFPYEITRCRKLADSTVSTRAIYGNYKSRTDFPSLSPWHQHSDVSSEFRNLYDQNWSELAVRSCSVCQRSFTDQQLHRYWISLRVGTDVLPLLVNACAQSCIDSLPPGAKDYVKSAHSGGKEVFQPKRM